MAVLLAVGVAGVVTVARAGAVVVTVVVTVARAVATVVVVAVVVVPVAVWRLRCSW